uniref:Uncharacterized protein n=1 Tax=Lotus japonicus TaxID=34305 RepID=I3T5D6_LOTJA|nr:unknown [Lotus japonicus]
MIASVRFNSSSSSSKTSSPIRVTLTLRLPRNLRRLGRTWKPPLLLRTKLMEDPIRIKRFLIHRLTKLLLERKSRWRH